jgi:predicted ferric reductase
MSQKTQKNLATLVVWPMVLVTLGIAARVHLCCRARCRSCCVLRRKVAMPPRARKWRCLAPFVDFTWGELLVCAGILGMFVVRLALFIAAFPEQSLGARNSGVRATFWRALGELNFVTLGLVLFPVARNSVWMYLLGISFERAVRFHRMMGTLTCVIMGAHGLGMWVAYAQAPSTAVKSFDFVLQMRIDEDTNWSNLSGLFCFICLVVMMLFTRCRRTHFTLFYLTHLLLAPLVLVFGFLHMPGLIGFMAPSLALYVIDVAVRVFRSCCRKTIVDSAVVLQGGTVCRVTLRKPTGFAYHAGQYCFVSVPGISALQAAHPFSISSASRADAREPFTLHIKNMGPGTFTHRLHEAAASGELLADAAKGGTVRVDGPYGNPSIDLHAYRCLVLCCGGIGVTPCAAVLADLVQHRWGAKTFGGGDKKEAFAEAKSSAAAVAPADAKPLPPLSLAAAKSGGTPCRIERVVLVWANRSTDALAWFAPLLQDAQRRLPQHVELALHITRGAADPEAQAANDALRGLPLLYKRPNYGELLDRLGKTYGGGGGDDGGGGIGVFACGPGAMVAAVQQASHTRSFAHFHKETFLL